jgi:P-type Ca2+ transporter type 2C
MNETNHHSDVGPRGLSSAEALRRLQQDGANVLSQPDRRNWLRIVWSVLREPMLLLLVGAAGIYFMLGDPQQAYVPSASVVLVIALTIYQKHKSERALRALRDLSSPRACALRDGRTLWVAASELVVGDVIWYPRAIGCRRTRAFSRRTT